MAPSSKSIGQRKLTHLTRACTTKGLKQVECVVSLSVGSVRFATLRRISKPPPGLVERKGTADKGFGAWLIGRRNGTGRAKTEDCGAPEEMKAERDGIVCSREINRTPDNREWSACTLAIKCQLIARKRRSQP